MRNKRNTNGAAGSHQVAPQAHHYVPETKESCTFEITKIGLENLRHFAGYVGSVHSIEPPSDEATVNGLLKDLPRFVPGFGDYLQTLQRAQRSAGNSGGNNPAAQQNQSTPSGSATSRQRNGSNNKTGASSGANTGNTEDDMVLDV